MKKFLFLMVLVATIGTTGASGAETKNTNDKNREVFRQLELFGTVFDRARSDYVEDVDVEKLIESAINGMLTSLDPHSSYLNKKTFRDMQVQTRGEFGGMGIEVTMSDGLVKVMSPIDDTPAFKAGIKTGDLITHLDGKPVRGLTLQQAVEKMRGLVGTKIKLTIRRASKQPFNVTITRAKIRITPVKARIEDKDIGYIRITSFNEQTTKGLKKAYRRISKEAKGKLKGLVLDLRNNPGGLLKESISVSDAFLDRGEIVSTRGRKKGEGQRWNATKGDVTKGVPMVVLVNGGSASAAEIVAGALQDHRRAIILGTRSFGKGSVQTIIPLPGHGAIRLTTQRYYTPSGNSIQAKGIKPDIVVKQLRVEEVSDDLRQREKDLRGALSGEEDKGKDKAPAKGDDAEKESPEVEDDPKVSDSPKISDYQLIRAVGILRGIDFYRQGAD
ncbi:MAG: S41 family peptidase [Alphaproteobacteria bacterium]|nr:S41 family peptidase [Alphaproteobacteria bacterium]